MFTYYVDDLYLIIILFDISQLSLIADDILLLSYLIMSEYHFAVTSVMLKNVYFNCLKLTKKQKVMSQ